MAEKRFIIDNESDIIEFDCDTNEYIDDFMWGDGKGWNRICNRLNELYDENLQLMKYKEENEYIKKTIQDSYDNERTDLGKNTLRQLLDVLK